MKKKSIGLIIGLMGFALLGVMAMQLYFLVQTYDTQSQLFDGMVGDALNNVVSKVSTQDAVNFLNEKARRFDNQQKTDQADNATYTYNTDRGDSKTPHFVNRKVIIRDSLKAVKTRLTNELAEDDEQGALTFRIRISSFTDDNGVTHQQRINEIVNTPRALLIKHGKLQQYDTLRYNYQDPQFGTQVVSHVQENPLWKAEQERKQKVRQLRAVKKLLADDSLEAVQSGNNHAVFSNIADEYQKMNRPLTSRLDPLLIDSLLRLELHNKGIYLPFSYEVSTANNDSLIFSKANDVSGSAPVFNAANVPYKTTIFTKDVLINDPGLLRVMFPEKSTLILNKMAFSMATSGGLLLILIFCFGYTIFSILKQKKISEMKTDFINNMTHEFKTPVSTIMIASEALKDEEVTADKGRIARLANIIYEENARLGSHIERVLNIARIEKNDFKLDIKPIEVNDTITAVVDSMALKLQKYNANVTMHLDAEYATINADELHFSNVLYNLVDNALKYSKGEPEIIISTNTVKNNLVFTIADKGIGMSREEQARIFEQFYRIPTGNLHDVKGFGLGLSYVNTIVKRLEGTIGVRSEKDKGSEFELKFPLV
ncbi:HAMP domain-containing histidine kinase [Mucilaginibacter mali]|uniref:histidine kinase n=1 Tax=Mucilaginibacter mali TaxID=2740462 RepID=A0A7D4QHC4_9SPHI|nr:HAMP domain-containing sensor histidine kinase [Mucilaginibacter mali]QKJ31852.1 HAMP domain-containing histidine kinase [Mucilaginibacter mali]